VALAGLGEGLSLKVTGIKCPQTSDDSLFAPTAGGPGEKCPEIYDDGVFN